MAATPNRLRAADRPNIPVPDDNLGYELVNGQLVAVTPASFPHFRLMFALIRIMNDFVEAKRLGAVAADTWFRLGLAHDPERTRAPDIAFIRAEKVPQVRAAGWGVLPFAPDLAVEIFSPANERKTADFHQRIRDYLDAGVGALWMIYPDARYATVYHPDGSARVLREGESLRAEDVLPGFEVALDSLWASLDITWFD